ncbi:hypothetical protein ACFXPA_42175 [Amycolatopsis sp. NPDC059090]|uniref:hypothetical protein n=1 Tax=Amycolatopsis sp. NPDC059090 TaxID=3346723 RepID=UPI00366BDF9C
MPSTAIAFASSSSFITQFGGFLTMLGSQFTLWAAIRLVDFYVERRGPLLDPGDLQPARHVSPVELVPPGWVFARLRCHDAVRGGRILPGPITKVMGGTDIFVVIGLAVAAGKYLLAARRLDVAADGEAVRAADAGLDPDVERLPTAR